MQKLPLAGQAVPEHQNFKGAAFCLIGRPTIICLRTPSRIPARGMATQAREFKAEPSSFAVISTMGMTRS
jgi:hypothetical protein